MQGCSFDSVQLGMEWGWGLKRRGCQTWERLSCS